MKRVSEYMSGTRIVSLIGCTAQQDKDVDTCVSIALGGAERMSVMKIPWLPRRKAVQAIERVCICHNGPFTKQDIEAGGRCKCCRVGHFVPHDFTFCTRCKAPIEEIRAQYRKGLPVKPVTAIE